MLSVTDYLQDAMRAFGSGAVTGASQFAGLPGELAGMFGKASNALFDQIDSSLGYQHPPTAAAQPYYNIMPTGDTLENLIRQHLTGPAYQPQTAVGQGAQMGGELLPALAFGGGAANLGTRVMAAGADPTRAILLNAMAGGVTGTQAQRSAFSDWSNTAGAQRLQELLNGFHGGSSPAY